MKKKGFTMIELLIVIAVIGILAVAVIAAINPIEQINRGKDTGSRSDTEQLIGGVDRFYAANGYYPWQTGADDVTHTSTSWISTKDVGWTDANGVGVLDKLSAAGTAELKLAFITRITDAAYNTLYAYNRGQQGDSTYLCFLPKSINFETEAISRCAGTKPGDFPADANVCPTGCDVSKTCYSCLP